MKNLNLLIVEGNLHIENNNFKELGIQIGFRSNMSIRESKSPLEIPREDQANVFKEMAL